MTIGEIENDDVKVYIKQDVYKQLEKYASSDTNHELGTIVLGVLIVISVGLIISEISLVNKYSKQVANQQNLANQIAEQGLLIESQADEIESFFQ